MPTPTTVTDPEAPATVECSRCRGTGQDPSAYHDTCQAACGGTGRIMARPCEQLEVAGYAIRQRWDYENLTSVAYHGGGQPRDWWDLHLPDGRVHSSHVNRTGAEVTANTLGRWDREDGDRAAVLATLTDEQLTALRDLIAPPCCHITGEHDPTHFVEGRYICQHQMAYAYKRLRHALGIPTIQPDEAKPVTGCGWCERHQAKATTSGQKGKGQ